MIICTWTSFKTQRSSRASLVCTLVFLFTRHSSLLLTGGWGPLPISTLYRALAPLLPCLLYTLAYPHLLCWLLPLLSLPRSASLYLSFVFISKMSPSLPCWNIIWSIKLSPEVFLAANSSPADSSVWDVDADDKVVATHTVECYL